MKPDARTAAVLSEASLILLALSALLDRFGVFRYRGDDWGNFDRQEAVVGGFTETGAWGVYTDNPAVTLPLNTGRTIQSAFLTWVRKHSDRVRHCSVWPK